MSESLLTPNKDTETSVPSKPLDINFNKPAWEQLANGNPESLIGLEWYGEDDNNIRRVSDYEVLHQPQWAATRTSAPTFKWRGQVKGGPVIERSLKYSQHVAEVDCWTVDVIGPDDEVKGVEIYYGYDLPATVKKSDLTLTSPIYKDDRAIMRALRQHRPRRYNGLKAYIDEYTGANDKPGSPKRAYKIKEFRKQDLPDQQNPGDGNIFRIQAPAMGPRVTLDVVKAQAERLGIKDLAGLTWLDEEGNIKQVIRQFNGMPTKDPKNPWYGQKLPTNYYVVRTTAKKRKFETGEPIIEEPGDIQYREPAVVFDENGQPITETRSMYIYSERSLQAHFDSRARAPVRDDPIDLHWEIPRHELFDKWVDADLLREEVHRLMPTFMMPVWPWLASLTMHGVNDAEMANKGSGIGTEDALGYLNSSLGEAGDESQKKQKLEELKSNPLELKYARTLQAIALKVGMDTVSDTAQDIADNAQAVMQQLGLERKPEYLDASKALRDLVISYHYHEYPEESQADGFELTASDPFAHSVSGRQAQREAMNHMVGESFADDLIARVLSETVSQQEVVNKEDGKTITYMVPEQAILFAINIQIMNMLSETDKTTADEIKEIIEGAVEANKNLGSGQAARVGRLLSRMAGR